MGTRSSKSTESQSSQGNLLGLTGIPLHFGENRPDAWPWDVQIVQLPALHQQLKTPGVTLDEMLRLLIDLSDETLKAELKDKENIPPVITLTNKETKLRRRFAKRIEELTPEDRLSCCGHSKADVQIVDGRPLLVDSRHEGKLLYGNDPIAWIRNGLHAIDAKVVSSLHSLASDVGWFLACPVLQIVPCTTVEGNTISRPTTPALYLGVRSVNRVIDEWRATFWFRDVQEGYELAAERLHACWLQQVPNTPEPDPAYRFIREPSQRLRDEALTFLRHAHDKAKGQAGVGDTGAGDTTKKMKPVKPAGRSDLAAGSKYEKKQTRRTRGEWAHKEPPPSEQKWWGPKDRPLSKLAEQLGICVNTIKKWNADGLLWVMRLHVKLYRTWFKAKPDFDKANREGEDHINET